MPKVPKAQSAPSENPFGAWLCHFITICTHNHEHVFGKIKSEEMHLSMLREIAKQCREEISKHFSNVELDPSREK